MSLNSLVIPGKICPFSHWSLKVNRLRRLYPCMYWGIFWLFINICSSDTFYNGKQLTSKNEGFLKYQQYNNERLTYYDTIVS